jgi:hypothetical protein
MDAHKIITHRLFSPIAVGTVSLVAGAISGYILGRRRVTKELRELLDEQIETIVTVTETIEFETSELIEAFKESDFEPEVKGVHTLKLIPDDVPETMGANIFYDVADGWDYDVEIPKRTATEPYIIHQDEFYGDEMGWDNQMVLTWYELDHVLVTHDDSVVYNPRSMVGDCLIFGHGSGDPNVVFIRNEKLHSEYEVFRNPSSFEIEVLGTFEEQLREEDLKHSRSPGKFPKQE